MDNQSNSCDLNFEVSNNLESNNSGFEIPNNIFQTWHTKKLPIRMLQSINKIRTLNPRFRYYLFDDNDCREFIKQNFDKEVLNAYDKLIPGAYKADLWRYCILYKYGGIYIDIKYHPVNNFKFFNLLKKEHWVLDNGAKGIYNAFMVCKSNNEILLKAINQIVVNVQNKFYGNCFLEPTGPGLLANFFTKEEMLNFDTKHILTGQNDYDKYILFNNNKILRCYSGYLEDRENHSKMKHYSVLWKERNIYL
jgi:mannosyltransferase OCH1-like enzyme